MSDLAVIALGVVVGILGAIPLALWWDAKRRVALRQDGDDENTL